VSSGKQGERVDDESEVESRFELMSQHTRHRGSVGEGSLSERREFEMCKAVYGQPAQI